MERKIGVIGGMGPMASQLFYKMVTEMTEATRDQEHLQLILISDTVMPDRTRAILQKEYDEVRTKLTSDAHLLERCGCDAWCVTCNTAHFFVDMIESEIKIPVIHLIKETVRFLTETEGSGKIAVLATEGTIKSGLYQRRLEEAGMMVYEPEKEIEKEVMYQVYERIKKSLPCDKASWNRIESSIREAGCDRAIMACTELSVLKQEEKLSSFYVDPLEILTRKVIFFSGHKLRRPTESMENRPDVTEESDFYL